MPSFLRRCESGDFVVNTKSKSLKRKPAPSLDDVGQREKKSKTIDHKSLTMGASVEVDVVGMSSDKELRGALLKSRFADTIFKSTQKIDSTRQERERLERERQRDKSRIHAEIRASRNQNDLKMKRERARMEIHKMEKTVEIYETMGIINDIEMLCFGSQRVKFLEQFGLFFKVDYLNEDLDAVLNAEEGEIVE